MTLKKKFILLCVAVVIMISFALVYITATGNTLSVHTRMMLPDANISNVSMQCDQEGVIEFTGFSIDNSEVVIDLKSVGQGRTKASFTFDVQYDDETYQRKWSDTFTVNSANVIVQTTNFTFSGYMVLIICILASLFLLLIFMIQVFFSYRRKGKFSYTMVSCGGIALYISILLLYIIYRIFNNYMFGLGFFLYMVNDVALLLLYALFPLMLVISVLLAFSNIWLIRHEGRRPVNMLGICFGMLWFLSTLFILASGYFPSLYRIPYYQIIEHIIIYVVSYFESMFISTALCAFLAVKYTPDYDRDYIMILGCAIRKDGSLTPLLKGRVDSALNFERTQFAKTGKHAVFVPSGGQGSDEVISEGEAMEKYLISQGVPDTQILREDKSTDTAENMSFSKKLIEQNTEDFESKKFAFATTNYHIFRGYILAQKNNMDAKGISAKTKPYFYPNAFIREFIGLLFDKLPVHIISVALILISIILLQCV